MESIKVVKVFGMHDYVLIYKIKAKFNKQIERFQWKHFKTMQSATNYRIKHENEFSSWKIVKNDMDGIINDFIDETRQYIASCASLSN